MLPSTKKNQMHIKKKFNEQKKTSPHPQKNSTDSKKLHGA
jgi:hypothetical protein